MAAVIELPVLVWLVEEINNVPYQSKIAFYTKYTVSSNDGTSGIVSNIISSSNAFSKQLLALSAKLSHIASVRAA